MAHVVDDGYRFSRRRGRPVHSEEYPWERWADGQRWLLVEGSDFRCPAPTLAKIAREWGKRNGYTVEASYGRDDDGQAAVLVRFTKSSPASSNGNSARHDFEPPGAHLIETIPPAEARPMVMAGAGGEGASSDWWQIDADIAAALERRT